ncbi:L-rhamnose mutarotase [Actinokineospora sp. HUAS TT18]|uniref:L-rhamnose mutarotase n=1 Tax=Actinokineospora sp. HUAS TT18 TaxID=3447451 RepID=UPI003F52300B
MEVVVTRTRLREGRELDYEAAHSVLPEDVRADLVARGIVDWKIFRDGRDLIHVITADPSYESFRTAVLDPEIGARWHRAMSPYVEPPGEGQTTGPLSLIWNLADEL